MFGSNDKKRLAILENYIGEQFTEFGERLDNLEKDWSEFIEWKKMRDANKEAAAKQGHFYISANDVALLEKLIQEVNNDPDLAVMMTTAQGTTLTLRTHPQPKLNMSYLPGFNGIGEE